MIIFYSDVEPFPPVTLHISHATRILNENPVFWQNEFFQDNN